MQNSNQNRAGEAILILNKIDFKSKLLQETKKGTVFLKGSAYGKDNYKHVCTRHQSSKLYEAKINRSEVQIVLQL